MLGENVKTIKNTILLRTKAKLCSCCMQLENKRNISFEHIYERLCTLHVAHWTCRHIIRYSFVIRLNLDLYVVSCVCVCVCISCMKSPLASDRKVRRKEMCQIQKSLCRVFRIMKCCVHFLNFAKVSESWITRLTGFFCVNLIGSMDRLYLEQTKRNERKSFQ